MRFSDIARSCTQNLLRRKSRTILTVLGVIVGCCSIVLIIFICCQKYFVSGLQTGGIKG